MASLLAEPQPIFITVILPDGGEKEFSCDTDWTVGEVEVKIHTTYKLTGGRLVRNGITVKDSVKFEPSMNGQLKFIDAIPERPHIGLASPPPQHIMGLASPPRPNHSQMRDEGKFSRCLYAFTSVLIGSILRNRCDGQGSSQRGRRSSFAHV